MSNLVPRFLVSVQLCIDDTTQEGFVSVLPGELPLLCTSNDVVNVHYLEYCSHMRIEGLHDPHSPPPPPSKKHFLDETLCMYFEQDDKVLKRHV